MSCLTKLEKLLCLKYLGRMWLANSGTFQTTKLLLLSLHDTTESVDESSTISYVLLRNGATPFTVTVAITKIKPNPRWRGWDIYRYRYRYRERGEEGDIDIDIETQRQRNKWMEKGKEERQREKEKESEAGRRVLLGISISMLASRFGT